MILDGAAEIIRREGVAQISLERIGQSAGVSKSLVYNYFDSLKDLLRELLDRELKALRRQQFEAAERAVTFEDLVRNITHVYLSNIEDRGLLIERLQAEPSLSDMHDPTDFSRSTAVDYLGQIVAEHFDMPLELALAATDISFGLPAAAGRYLMRGPLKREDVEELTVSMIMGSVTMARTDYLLRKQKIKR